MAGRWFALIALWVLLPSTGAVAGTLEIEFDLSQSTLPGAASCCRSVSGSVLLRARGVSAIGTASGEAVFATLSGLSLRIANTNPLGGGLAASITNRVTLVQRGTARATLGLGGLQLASGAFVADGSLDFGCVGIDCLRILIAGRRGPFTFVNDVPAFASLPGRATPGAARLSAILGSARLSFQLSGAEVRRTFVSEPDQASFALVALAMGFALVSAAGLLRGCQRDRSIGR